MLPFLWDYQHSVTHTVHTSLRTFVQHDLRAMFVPVDDIRDGDSCLEMLPSTEHDLRAVMLHHQADSCSEEKSSQG